jgi:hypothetical protein
MIRASIRGVRTLVGVIELTDAAFALLGAAASAARRFVPDAGVRIVRAGEGVRFELADGPLAEDLIIERDDVRLFVAPDLEGIVDVVEPHGTLVLRASNERGRT